MCDIKGFDMAIDTPLAYRSLVLYEVYTRNHGIKGTFAEVEADLERLKALGVDIVWFMPIHPIGKKERKGSLGSSYSIADYREVNPKNGTKEDFARLIKKAHDLDLKVMIDVVSNHTAHDSNLLTEHPTWYNQNALGEPVTTNPAWADIIDLKYPNQELEDYLVETLAGWVSFGVDGFRCDVASLVPLHFWLRARARCAEINPNTIWLAESVHASYIESRRRSGLTALSDSQVFQAFDMSYDYDIWPIWQAVVTGVEPVSRYLEMLRFQSAMYPANYVKMRCVENHDQARIMLLAPSADQALAWTAFEAFNIGSFLIYDGQESGSKHTPDQFESDRIEWNNYPLSPFLATLAKLKKDAAIVSGVFSISAAEPAIVAEWEAQGACLLGIFNVRSQSGKVAIPLPDGDYQDLLYGKTVKVLDGKAEIPTIAAILHYIESANPHWFYSTLLDLHIPRDSA